ncbi:MAG: biotin-dependent carboxyltransferase family protein [Pseudomonadota bacterium]
MLRVVKAGMQTTLQGRPRMSWRHMGVPASGPADPLSMALANRLVGNALYETSLEISYGGFEARVEEACVIAITGASGEVKVSDQPVDLHRTLHLKEGDSISIEPPAFGVRTYLAVSSGFQADEKFGSSSTYLPAGFGGFEGRALKAGDHLHPKEPSRSLPECKTPDHLKPVFSSSFALRACTSAEFGSLSSASQKTLFHETFIAGRQATRMGITLTGHILNAENDGLMKSAPVFPGTLQCPPSGAPIALLADAQTTGGYPRIASIARCDRYLMGQIRPGNRIRLLPRSPDTAQRELLEKRALFSEWFQGRSVF